MLLRLLRAPFRLILLYWLVLGLSGMLVVAGDALNNLQTTGEAFALTGSGDFILAFLYAPINGLNLLLGTFTGAQVPEGKQLLLLYSILAFLGTAFLGMVFNSGFLVFVAALIPLLYTLFDLQAWQWLSLL